MAFAFILMGLIAGVAAYRDKLPDLFNALKSDLFGDDNFTNGNNFILWFLVMAILVALGTIQSIRPITDAFLALVILVIIVAAYKNGNDIFGNFLDQIKKGTQ